MNVLLIALIHALPIIISAVLLINKSVVNVITVIMVVVALMSGSPKYFIFDLMSVVFAWFYSMSIVEKNSVSSNNKQRSNRLSLETKIKNTSPLSSTVEKSLTVKSDFPGPRSSILPNYEQANKEAPHSENGFVETTPHEIAFNSFRDAAIFAKENPGSVVKRAADETHFIVTIRY